MRSVFTQRNVIPCFAYRAAMVVPSLCRENTSAPATNRFRSLTSSLRSPIASRSITAKCVPYAANQIYHLDSEGKFSLMDIGERKKGTQRYTFPTWADYDNDGLLDAVVWAERGLLGLCRNLAGQGFTNVAASAFPSPLTNCQAFWVGDYDNDGWQDLVFYHWAAQAPIAARSLVWITRTPMGR